MNDMRKRVEAILADCQHMSQDVPASVWESFVSRVEVVAHELLARLVAEEEVDQLMAEHLDRTEAELGARIAEGR